MHRAFARAGPFRRPAGPMNERPILALDITDMGVDEGIDVAIHDEDSNQLLFETVLVDPDSKTLLAFGSSETEAFWQCLHTHRGVGRDRHLFLTARCRFNLLTALISPKRISHAEVRSARFLRLIEEVCDELKTREPGMVVEIAVTHRNPAFADFIRY